MSDICYVIFRRIFRFVILFVLENNAQRPEAALDTPPLIGSNNQPKLSCSESVEKKAAFFLARSFALLLIGFFAPSR